MTNKTIESSREVGGDYFKLVYSRRSNKNLQFYLDQFNHEDYYIYKSTRIFKEVNYQDLLEFKYAGYILFKRDLYNKEWIDMWIDWLYSIKDMSFLFMNKPFPAFNPEDKIKIKK